MSASRFSIGIDLGTTHCALAYVDISASDGEKTCAGVLNIPQLTGPGAHSDEHWKVEFDVRGSGS